MSCSADDCLCVSSKFLPSIGLVIFRTGVVGMNCLFLKKIELWKLLSNNNCKTVEKVGAVVTKSGRLCGIGKTAYFMQFSA